MMSEKRILKCVRGNGASQSVVLQSLEERRPKAHDGASGSCTRNEDVQCAMAWKFVAVRCETRAARDARTSSNAGCVHIKAMRNVCNAYTTHITTMCT